MHSSNRFPVIISSAVTAASSRATYMALPRISASRAFFPSQKKKAPTSEATRIRADAIRKETLHPIPPHRQKATLRTRAANVGVMLFTSAIVLRGVIIAVILAQKQFCVNANKKGKEISPCLCIYMLSEHPVQKRSVVRLGAWQIPSLLCSRCFARFGLGRSLSFPRLFFLPFNQLNH